jgi:hypothetical protein
VKAFDLTDPLIAAGGLVLLGVLLVLQRRERRVSVWRVWLVPVLPAVLTGLSILRHRPASPWAWAWLGLGLVIGLSTGSVRSGLTRIRDVDRATGVLLVQPSLLAVLVWLVAFLARIVVRQVVGQRDPDPSTAGLVAAALLTATLGPVLARAVWVVRTYVEAPPAPTSSRPERER